MGSSASKSEHEAKIWHEELAEMQRIQMERQIELQNMMWERTMALSAARTRDSFVFLTAIGVIVSFASLTTLARTYPKTHLWKILPVGIVFAAGYHFRRAYGHELIDVT
uniref:Uncharacterized protein n=1 Tax=Plectus sambesii TaxID=2011161 RepID=A0A914X582_9BILA